LLATGIAVLLARTVDISAVTALLRQAAGQWVAAALLCNLLIVFCWTQQWRALMPTASAIAFRRMLPLIGMASLAGNTAPASGQISTVVLLSSEPNVPRSVAVSVLALDQVVEGITKLSLLGLVAFLAPLPAWMRPTLLALVLGMMALVAGLVLLANQSRWLQQYVQALETLRNGRKVVVSVWWCCLSKISEGVAILAVQNAFGVHVPISVTLLVLAAVQLGTLVPLSPGNIGTYEASAMAAYHEGGVSAEVSLSLAITQHVCLLFSTAGVGYLLFVLRDWVRGTRMPDNADAG
jgi:uncharacterized membrane protein YbhN (UPF0104 family)